MSSPAGSPRVTTDWKSPGSTMSPVSRVASNRSQTLRRKAAEAPQRWLSAASKASVVASSTVTGARKGNRMTVAPAGTSFGGGAARAPDGSARPRATAPTAACFRLISDLLSRLSATALSDPVTGVKPGERLHGLRQTTSTARRRRRKTWPVAGPNTAHRCSAADSMAGALTDRVRNHPDTGVDTLHNPWVGVDLAADRVAWARLLRRAHEVALGGRGTPAVLRDVIVRSWARCEQARVDPDRPAPVVLDAAETASRFATHPLSSMVPTVRDLLSTVSADARHLVTLGDA